MTAILITLAIIACSASYLFGAIIAAGARADLEAENTALKQIIKKAYHEAAESLTDGKGRHFITNETFVILRKAYNLIQSKN